MNWNAFGFILSFGAAIYNLDSPIWFVLNVVFAALNFGYMFAAMENKNVK